MYNRITEFLNFNGILHEMQYGFRQGRSCEHALLKAKQVLLDSLSRRQVSLLLLIDFSKAFDMVEHSILLKKLEHYGIRSEASQWITSYLHNRMQFVSIDGTDSKTRHMQYGVPQGSILGPLVFIIYINDIPNFSQLAKFILYAYMLMTQISLLRGIILLKSMRSYVICVKFSSNGLTQMASALTLRKLNI